MSNSILPASSEKYSNAKPFRVFDNTSASLYRNKCDCDHLCWYLTDSKTHADYKVEHKGAIIQNLISVWVLLFCQNPVITKVNVL